MADDLGNQLDLQNQINAAIQARAGLLRKQSAFLEGQVLIARELCHALKCEQLDGMDERLGQIRNSMEQAANEAGRLPSTFDEGTKSVDEVGKSLTNVVTVTGALNGALNGVRKSLLTVKAAAVGTFDAFKGGFNIVSAIGGLFNRFTSQLIAAAVEAASKGQDIAKAYEELRDTFGDLSVGIGKEAVDAVGEFDKAAAAAGVNTGKFFGPFTEGRVAKIKAIGEAISNLGDLAIGPLSGQVAGAAFEMTMLQRGAGLSAEAMQGLGNRALLAGQDLKSVMGDAAAGIANVANAMGVSEKSIGKNFDAIAKDVASFGHLTVKEMTSLAAVMTKTGISMSTVQKIGSQFDDFEKGAQSVAQLTQAFGMQLDAVELLNATDDDRIAMMKSSFQATGKSIDQLSRQEKAYLANAAGIEANDLERVFGDQAGAIEETKTAAEQAQEAQISSAEAMQEMAKNIKNVFAPIESFLGFLDAFLKGFKRGFLDGNVAFMQVYETLWKIKEIGYDLGLFLREFINRMGGFQAVFDLEGTVEMFRLLSQSIKEFLDPVAAGTSGSAGKLMAVLTAKLEKGVEVVIGLFHRIVDWFKKPETQKMMADAGQALLQSLSDLFKNPAIVKGTIGVGLFALVTTIGQVLFSALIGTIPGLLMKAFKFIFGKGFREGVGKIFKGAFKKLAPRLIGGPYTLIAALIAGFGMAISGASDKIGDQLDAEFGDMAPMTKLAAGMINAVTFGLLPDSMLLSVSRFFGNLQKSFLEGLEALGLGSLVDYMKEQASAAFDIFDSLGTLLSNLFKPGKMKEVSAAGGQFLTGLFNMFISQLKLLPTIFMEYIPKAIIFALKETALLLINYGIPLLINALTFIGGALWSVIKNVGAFMFGAFKAGLIDPIVMLFTDPRQLLMNITNGLVNIYNAVVAKVTGMFGWIGKQIKNFVSRIKNPFAAANDEVTESVSQIDPAPAQAQIANAANLTSNLQEAQAALGSGENGALGVAKALVADHNLVTDELRKLGEGGVDLDTTIDRIERGTTTTRSGITIDRQQIQLNVNLQVNLEADKLAKALSDRSIVDQKLVLSRAGTPV